MRTLLLSTLLFLVISCTNKSVYWCGDHPCINKKEKEAYFKKTMIVEKRTLDNENYKNNSEIEKILQEAQKREKVRIKNERDLAKQTKLEEKKLARELKNEEKKRLKEEKKLARQIERDERKRAKNKKKYSKKKLKIAKKEEFKKNIELTSNTSSIEIQTNEFSELIKKVRQKNIFKSYPNINDIPN